MTIVTRAFAVTPDPDVVVAYRQDFGNAEQWDPGTESCTRLDSGPVAPGAQWRNVSKIAGISTELTYTPKELTDDTIVLVGENDSATSTDTITVKPHGSGGSEVTYRADVEMHGIAKVATPAVKLVFEKLGNDTEKQLTDVLNGLH